MGCTGAGKFLRIRWNALRIVSRVGKTLAVASNIRDAIHPPLISIN
jgi:hypothetical protein